MAAWMMEPLLAGVRDFPANMMELLKTPKTLALFLVGMAALFYSFTDIGLLSFFGPTVLALGLIAYMIYLWHKAGYKLDKIRRIVVSACVTVIITSASYGYAVYYVNDIDIAVLPPDRLHNFTWERAGFLDQHQAEFYGLLRVEVRGYMYEDLDLSRAPYPGAIWLATVKTVAIPSQEMMDQRVTALIENLKQEGLTIDKNSKTTGSETLGNGREAQFVEYEATLGTTGSGAFYSTAQGAKVRIRAEWWSCPDHGTAIVAIGAAQYGNTLTSSRIQNFIIGRQPDNYDTFYSIKALVYAARCA